MFSKKDNFFSEGIHHVSCQIINTVCEKLWLKSDNTRHGIQDFTKLCQTLSSVMERRLPYEAYKNLAPEICQTIKNMLCSALIKSMLTRKVRPYYFYDQNITIYHLEHTESVVETLPPQGNLILAFDEHRIFLLGKPEGANTWKFTKLDPKMTEYLSGSLSSITLDPGNDIVRDLSFLHYKLLNEITLKNAHAIAKPTHVIFPDYWKCANNLSVELESAFIEIFQLIKRMSPDSLPYDIKKSYIFENSVLDTAENILISIVNYWFKRSRPITNLVPACQTLANALVSNMNYDAYFQLDQQSKAYIKSLIVSKLAAIFIRIHVKEENFEKALLTEDDRNNVLWSNSSIIQLPYMLEARHEQDKDDLQIHLTPTFNQINIYMARKYWLEVSRAEDFPVVEDVINLITENLKPVLLK